MLASGELIVSDTMSETPELDSSDKKPPGADQSSIDWLEHLASEPDAIWGSATAEADSDDAPDVGEKVSRVALPEHNGHETGIRTPDVMGPAHSAARLEPTIESPETTREQVQSLVRALEEDDESAVAADLMAEEVENLTAWQIALRARYPAKDASAPTTDEFSREGRTEVHPPQAQQDLTDYSEELVLEINDLMWLDDMEKMPEMKRNPHEEDELLPANEDNDLASDDSRSEGTGEAAPASSLETNLDEVPDDPDEAIAWLERLAAKQGAPLEELPTFTSEAPGKDSISEAEPSMFGLGEMDAGEIPEDPDEAMAWLEMLAAKEVAQTGLESSQSSSGVLEAEAPGDVEALPEAELTAEALSADLDEALEGSLPSGLDEALDWLEELTIEPGKVEVSASPEEPLLVVEEPPTPAVAHHVDQALAGAEMLFAESGTSQLAADAGQTADELQYDDADDAMAWLEQLAARQGAPIEELTTIDVEPEELAQVEEEVEEITDDAWQPIDDARADVPSIAGAPEVDEEPVPGAEQPAVAMADESLAVSDDFIESAHLEAAETDEVTVVEASDVEPAIAQKELETETVAAQGEMEIAAEPQSPAEDLAWLDTLGAVDAEKWLEAEAAEQDEGERVAIIEAADDEGQPEEDEAVPGEVEAGFGIAQDGPASEALAEARQELKDGKFDESLIRYAALVEEGQFLALLIDDLEAISEQRGPEPGLQRVLGDAYARNGQLRKALESYREALANL